MQENIGKKIVLEFLSYLQYKVKNNLMTMEEIESLARMFEDSLTILGTSEDFSRFYNQPRTNVSNVISRKLLEKPVRKIYYSFKAFRKIVPDTWHYHKNTSRSKK